MIYRLTPVRTTGRNAAGPWGASLRAALCLLFFGGQLLTFGSVAHVVADQVAAYTVNGTVYDDHNQNGTQSLPLSSSDIGGEPGINGVDVTAYDGSGSQVVTTSTQTNANLLGQYTLSIPAGTGAVRIQFSNLPSGYLPSHHDTVTGMGTDNGTSVAFVAGSQATNTVNLAIERPSEYCQSQVNVTTSCYTLGDQKNTNNPAIVKFAYDAMGTTPAPNMVATAPQVGTTFGLAYRRSSQSLFAASYFKRHAGFKPDGDPGAIYLINNPDSAAPTIEATPFVTLNAGPNQHDTGNYVTDLSAYSQVGKVSLGGVALSEDESTLYVMNLFDRSLYSVPVGAPPAPPVAGTPVPHVVPVPSDCTQDDFRPFAVTAYHGLIYVGAVCSAESTVPADGSTLGDPSKLQAYMLSYDPATASFSPAPIFQFALNYPRHCVNDAYLADCAAAGTSNINIGEPAAWNAWHTTYIGYSDQQDSPGQVSRVYPQPLFTGIAFDNGNLIIGLRDRYGDQMGYQSPEPDNTSVLVNGITAGDTLRACLKTPGDLNSGWLLESNATCGGVTTGGANNAKGPDAGHYYYQDNFFGIHDNVSLGSVLQIPGFSTVEITSLNPVNSTFTGGTRVFKNTDGTVSSGYQVYGQNVPGVFGKSNGLGSLTAFCENAPLEIGNRVWIDRNSNGIQDAGELDIAGVTVHLYAADGRTLLATTTTNSMGNYYFNKGNVTGGIPAYASYVVKLDNPGDYATGGPLAGYQPTLADQDSMTHSIDSKGVLSSPDQLPGSGNYPQYTTGTLTPGQNDGEVDFGFTLLPDLNITKVNQGTDHYIVGQQIVYTIAVHPLDTAGPVLIPNSISVVDSIPAGLANIRVLAPDWQVNLDSSISPSTITATYTGKYPLEPGMMTSPITVKGTFTADAVPQLVNTATVSTPGDSNPTNNTAADTLQVMLPTPMPMPTPTPTPISVTAIPTGTVTPAPLPSVTVGPGEPPDMAVNKTNLGGSVFAVGQNVTYQLLAANEPAAGSVLTNDSILVRDVIPVGLSNISATGMNWNITVSSLISPTLITATYVGAYPVAPGMLLPPVTVIGTLTPDATPALTDSAIVNTPGDFNSLNNMSSDTVFVSAIETPLPTPTLTAIAMPTPTAMPMSTMTPTATVSVTPTSLPPDVSITKKSLTSDSFQVGQSGTFVLTVDDSATAGPVVGQNSLLVQDVLPVGWVNIHAEATNWLLTITSDRSPTLLTATYQGAYPIPAGTILPPIFVTGTFTLDAVPSITNMATVSVPDDVNVDNNMVAYTVNVAPLPTPTLAPTATATPTPPAGPDLALVKTAQGGSIFFLEGQTITYNLAVQNVSSVAAATGPASITVTDTLPIGITNLSAVGSNWAISLSALVSPAQISATYVGSYPLLPGASLPPIVVAGTFTPAALPMFVNSATVTTPGDANPDNNTDTYMAFVSSPALLTPTAVATAPTAPILLPDVFIAKTNSGGDHFQIGQTVNYILTVGDAPMAGPLLRSSSVRVTDVLPTGLINIAVWGEGWTISLSNVAGPAMLVATYTGTYPVVAGTIFPPILLSGELTQDAVPSLTNVATVSTAGDSNPNNNVAVDTIFVQPYPNKCDQQQNNCDQQNHRQKQQGNIYFIDERRM